jgi:flagellar biosynthetic protein FlhB
MLLGVPQATVVITNPTHLAVAVRYEKSMEAPIVVAKGAEQLARRIRESALDHGIPLVERKDLARSLYKTVEVGQSIPPGLYQAVAEILAYVYRLKGVATAA